MEKRNIIVIGASAGGLEAIKRVIAGLPAGLDAAIFIVWHMSPDVKGILPEIINKRKNLRAVNATDGEPIEMGTVYVAPPDHHMLLEKGRIRVTRGPKENRFRPAIDPLFRSAAQAYGARVIGVILTGALDDGSAGLWTIKDHGGLAVVQDPADAEVPSMPENALRAVNADYIVSLSEMPRLLVNVSAEKIGIDIVADMDEKEKNRLEVGVAMQEGAFNQELLKYGQPSMYTCPDCYGVLSVMREGNIVRFRCHTGHAFSTDTLLAAITESIENGIWSAIRSIQESIILLNHMGDHFAEINQPKLAAMYFKKAIEAERRAELLRPAVFSHEQLSMEDMEQQAAAVHNKPGGQKIKS